MKKSVKRYLAGTVGIIAVAVLMVSAGRNDFRVARDLEVLFNLFREVNTYYVDTVDTDRLLKNAALGMLDDLDPYTEFLPESEMENFEIQTTGKYGGIGSLIRKNGDWVEIAEPYKGFAADKAGLKIGDRIVAIDGKDAKGMTTEQVSALMKGDPNTTLRLKIQRFADGQTVELAIKRERIAISGVTYSGMLQPGVGYIALSDFSEDCSADVKRAIMDLKTAGATSLVFDLRNNGGGILQEAVKIVGMFVPRGTEVVAVRGRVPGSSNKYSTSTDPIFDGKLVVLVNRSSASASEIVAGALQDVDRAVLVGQRSFGKGLVQSTYPLGYNSYAKITIAKYYIPSGRCIQAVDYSHRDENGSAIEVPDSLIREFQTRAGRKVYDGGGVMPDVKLDPEYMSIFTYNLYVRGYIEDFGGEYAKKHNFTPVDVDTFRLSDEAYADFGVFMRDKPLDFESETQLALDELEKIAERERYDERIAPELAAIREKISKNKETELELNKQEVSELIEDNIILRQAYQEGVMRHKLHSDRTVAEALKLIASPDNFTAILTSRDTARK